MLSCIHMLNWIFLYILVVTFPVFTLLMVGLSLLEISPL